MGSRRYISPCRAAGAQREDFKARSPWKRPATPTGAERLGTDGVFVRQGEDPEWSFLRVKLRKTLNYMTNAMTGTPFGESLAGGEQVWRVHLFLPFRVVITRPPAVAPRCKPAARPTGHCGNESLHLAVGEAD
ncbi:hypothetical protein SKAU_G00298940 [Synaphobranchus kaupii]|uniref:Uncharacterized protein n=1 Tax=Synaphobranchus kaupii TaxID=118154 RepID=A0A9Q1IN37_SYNKA|nr:hypothetical protein SKAU_G00298940 [Synaphobranchus kaupii]